ncbi:hypothetical protein GCM10025857_17450 [Alicyclobacillus contaminans]|nr:hypothetical protein GCM10025857_17450 [Alicyclobacillus contaminans]
MHGPVATVHRESGERHMDADNNIYTDLAYQMLILHRNMNISLTKLGLTRTQMHILSYLSRHDVVKASELADAVGISYSSVTWHCNELEKQALLTRSQSATDRRNVHIRLTDTGKAKLRDIREHRKQQLLKLFANFDEAEVHTFMTLISKVNRFAHEMWDEEARTGLPPGDAPRTLGNAPLLFTPCLTYPHNT